MKTMDIWDRVFKNGRSKICGRQPLKILKGYTLYPFKFFKGCLPQILLDSFLNNLDLMLSRIQLHTITNLTEELSAREERN